MRWLVVAAVAAGLCGPAWAEEPISPFWNVGNSEAAAPVNDEKPSFPASVLQPYKQFRAALIRSGLKPVPSPYLGKNPLMYGYREVVCGNRLCTADWRNADGRQLSFTLWFGSKRNDYVVAPQVDFPVSANNSAHP